VKHANVIYGKPKEIIQEQRKHGDKGYEVIHFQIHKEEYSSGSLHVITQKCKTLHQTAVPTTHQGKVMISVRCLEKPGTQKILLPFCHFYYSLPNFMLFLTGFTKA
jgi:hypothetical protein